MVVGAKRDIRENRSPPRYMQLTPDEFANWNTRIPAQQCREYARDVLTALIAACSR